MNINGRHPRKRRRDKLLVGFVCFCRFYFGILVTLWLASPILAADSPGSETQKRGGILRLARSADPQTLDPVLMFSALDAMLCPLLYLPLLDGSCVTNLVPCAAETWSASPDQRIFTFQLRPGVTFSDGRMVVADDYVFTLERILNPATGSAMSAYMVGIRGAGDFISGKTNHIAGVIVLSPVAFRIELEHPDITFPYIMMFPAMPREHVVGREGHYGIRPIGTGPYMVESWVRGARLKLTRNPHYQGPEPQHFDGVDLLIGGDETTHLMMFERGELDIANIDGQGIPRPSFRRLTQDPIWRDLVQRVQSFGTRFVSLNTEIPPLNNVLVRRAINHAIDRDRRLQVTSGFASHAEGVLPPIMPGYNPHLRGYQYEPGKARQLLLESALPMPLRTELWHGHSDGNRYLAQGIQWDLKQVGIEIELKEMADSALFVAMTIRKKVPMTLLGYGPVIPDPKDMLGNPFNGNDITNTPTLNWAFYNNPVVTSLLQKAAAQTDWQLRFKLYQRAEEMIVSDAPWAFLGHEIAFALRQPWLKGPLLDASGGYRFDRVWFEK